MKNNNIEDLIPKLSQLLNVDEQALTAVIDVLDYSKCRNLIILNEFKQAVKEGGVYKAKIVEILMLKYNISKASVEHVIYSRTLNKARYCKTCRTKMTKYKYGKNGGICDKCLMINT